MQLLAVRVFRPAHYQQNTQWIRPCPLAEIRIVGSVFYDMTLVTVRHPPLRQQLTITTALPLLATLLMRNTGTRSVITACT